MRRFVIGCCTAIPVIAVMAVCIQGCTAPEVTARLDEFETKVESLGAAIKENPELVDAGVGILGAVNPLAGIIGSAVLTTFVTLFGTYKKWKQPLAEANSNINKLILGLSAAGEVIETSVKPNVELWAVQREKMRKARAAGGIMPDKLKVVEKDGMWAIDAPAA